MTLLEKFRNCTLNNNLFTIKDNLLIAVSGGVDSVVLCELCYQAGFKFTIAHCNFKLRGKESERDEEFVRSLGKKYNVDVLVNSFDTEKYAAENKLSIQEAARELRYSWFNDLLSKNQPPRTSKRPVDLSGSSSDFGLPTSDFLLTAHHADDNIETLLMNFFRGTGLHGLTGIPSVNNKIRRPLLEFTKQELLDFANENKLEYVQDSSNESSKYTRNFFRNELLPAIAKVYPEVHQNLRGNIDRFTEIEKLYRLGLEELKKKICRQKGEELHVPVLQLMKLNNRALIYEIISPYGFTEGQVDEVMKLAKSDSGKYLQTNTNDYRLFKHRQWFIISPTSSQQSENLVIDEGSNKYELTDGILSLELMEISQFPNSKIPKSNGVACVDGKDIEFPLLLRKWKQGDYFYPLGMKKKKKIARFFIDNKISATSKQKIRVIESNKRIIWVVGMRIDERFKVDDNTKKILKLQWSPAE